MRIAMLVLVLACGCAKTDAHKLHIDQGGVTHSIMDSRGTKYANLTITVDGANFTVAVDQDGKYHQFKGSHVIVRE